MLARSRRLALVLITSQMRSGNSGSDPTSFWGRPAALAALDVVLFVGSALVGDALLGPGGATLAATVNGVIPFLPLAAVGVVLIAGTMFELTTTARFSGSDIVNWMPITPGEYVVGSSSAIAFTYSPTVAIILGGLLPFELAAGAAATYGLTAGLVLLALFEGAFFVEIIRAIANRAGSLGSARHGSATFVLRAVLLVLVILALDLALNPIFLFGAVARLSTLPALFVAVPPFWATAALAAWVAGATLPAAGFAIAAGGFVGLIAVAAAAVRARYWVPTTAEVRIEGYRYAATHPLLAALGLSRPEAAIASKDLRGFVRRRELLPLLAVPIVLVLLLAIEGRSFGTLGAVLWVGWVAGFFGLLLSVTAVGQERRSFQLLLAFPISAENVFRAKCAATALPVATGAAAISIVASGVAGLSWPSALALALLCTGSSVVMVLWGLVFASRYADFQDRPRPQFVRPTAMLAATGSGVVILATMIVPGGFAAIHPSLGTLGLGLTAAGIALVIGATAYGLARRGFEALFRELPF